MKKRGAGSPLLRLMLVPLLAFAAFTVAGNARTSIVNALIRVNPTTFVRGQQAVVTVDLVALGGADPENAVSFSLHFEPTQLAYVSAVAGTGAPGASVIINTSQVASGNVGFAVAKSSGVAFAVGTNQVLAVTFTALGSAALASTPITLVDTPISRELASVTAHEIPFDPADGMMTVVATSPYEADTAPRQTGGGTVVVSDWVQAGRFSVGLDAAVAGTEFQRADCAPKAAKGDGLINVSDWVQAGRFSVALDPLSLAGGPTAPPGFQSSFNDTSPENSDARPRTISLKPADANLIGRQIGTFEVDLDAVGNENALGFSLSYDQNKLEFVGAFPRQEQAAHVFVNPLRAADGHIAVALALSPGQRFEPGRHSLLTLRFLPKPGELASGSTIRFDDSVIRRQVVGPDAVPLAKTHYVDGRAPIDAPTLAMSRGSRQKLAAH
jgi:hypothetical protein